MSAAPDLLTGMGKLRVLSLGAGTQSSALLLLLDREPERVGGRADLAVFADTGDEPSEVYSWLERLRGAVSIPIVVARKAGMGPSLSEDQLSLRTSARSPWYTLGPDRDEQRGMLPRNCTRDYKIVPIQQAIRAHLGVKPRQRVQASVEQLIGISADEAHRMKPSRESWITNHWPLVDLGWKRADCRRHVEFCGLGTPPRSACIMCPFHNASEWRALRDQAPDEWDRAIDFDRRLRTVSPAMGLRSKPFVHSSRVPLGEAALGDGFRNQPDLFGNECEGMCGV